MQLTPNQLAMVCAATVGNASKYCEYMNAYTRQNEINTFERCAMFLAQISHESGRLSQVEENLSYSAKRLTVVWPKRFPTLASAEPFAFNPRKLANKVYGGRMGNTEPDDGWRYRGRGLKQLTGKDNYTKMAGALGTNIVDFPENVAMPDYAVRTACVYWGWANGNALADAGNYRQLSININGGLVGYEDGNDVGLDDRVELLQYTRSKLSMLGSVLV